MSTQCDCNQTFIKLPVHGITFDVDGSALPSGGGSGDGISYSLEEQFTGKYWIDGKKIYQKTVDTGGLPNAAIKKIPHGVLNMDTVISMNGLATMSSKVYSIFLPYSTTGNNPIMLYMENPEKSIVIRTFSDYRVHDASYVTIQYTCTDR